MIPENRVPTHPGVILSQEFLAPLRISQVTLATHLGVPVQRVNELVRGKRGITPETAWLLAQALDTSPEYWLNLQAAHDLARIRPARSVEPLRAASWDLAMAAAHRAAAGGATPPIDGQRKMWDSRGFWTNDSRSRSW